jgi:DNA polymerase-3 subunit alpha
MTNLLVQSNCRDMRCLCAIVSVIRPGVADESKKLAFTRRHQGYEPASYPHPDLADCLADTYGLLVYEEHILMVAHHFANMNLGRADVLRRELVKMKNPEKLVELGVEFADRARGIGRNEDDIRRVWGTLVNFHGYMFNKAHSASYAVEAYQGAWLKCRWPAETLAAVLDNQRGFYSPLFYILEARRLGIPARGPDVNASRAHWMVEADSHGRQFLRAPLRWINGLGSATVARWQSARTHAAFTHPIDFLQRVRPPPEDLARLLDAGALDSFDTNRARLFWQCSRVPVHAEDLFANQLAARRPAVPEDLTSPGPADRAARELAMLGFPHSLDPFSHFGPDLDWDKYCPLARLHRHRGRPVMVAGLIVQSRRTHTLKGAVMFFGTLADPSGFAEFTVFPPVYRRCGHLLERGGVILLHAEVEPFDNHRGQNLMVNRVWRAGAT